MIVTVYPDKLEGEWWALTNYDTTRRSRPSPPPETPKFEKLDTFTLADGFALTVSIQVQNRG